MKGNLAGICFLLSLHSIKCKNKQRNPKQTKTTAGSEGFLLLNKQQLLLPKERACSSKGTFAFLVTLLVCSISQYKYFCALEGPPLCAAEVGEWGHYPVRVVPGLHARISGLVPCPRKTPVHSLGTGPSVWAFSERFLCRGRSSKVLGSAFSWSRYMMCFTSSGLSLCLIANSSLSQGTVELGDFKKYVGKWN